MHAINYGLTNFALVLPYCYELNKALFLFHSFLYEKKNQNEIKYDFSKYWASGMDSFL